MIVERSEVMNLQRLRTAGILSTTVVLVLGMVDMFLQLGVVDWVLTPYFIAPLFVAAYGAAPLVTRWIERR